jgi:hypothetical protein
VVLRVPWPGLRAEVADETAEHQERTGERKTIMPFYFRVRLPGPFVYAHRVGGKRHATTTRPKPQRDITAPLKLTDAQTTSIEIVLSALPDTAKGKMTIDHFNQLAPIMQRSWIRRNMGPQFLRDIPITTTTR